MLERINFSVLLKHAHILLWAILTVAIVSPSSTLYAQDDVEEYWGDDEEYDEYEDEDEYLDDDEYRDKKAQESLDYVNTHLSWDPKGKAIKRLSKDIDKVIKSAPSANPDGEGMGRVLKDLKEAGSLTKRELISQRWGSCIKFTQYRRALMEHPNVMDTHQRISTYQWVEKNKK